MIAAIEKFQISVKLKTPFVLRQSKQPAGGENLSIGILHRTYSPYRAYRVPKRPFIRLIIAKRSLFVVTGSQFEKVYSRSSRFAWFEPRIQVRQCILKRAISLLILQRKRRRVLKNNERLAHAAKTKSDLPPEDVQDQGFTRPSILILLPFRSSASDWFSALTSHTPSPAYQIENQSRFVSEYGLPPGAVDKLATAEPGTYPRDHVETFKGNVDDNFRVGVKMTRKSVKMFSEFYDSDIVIASPLGLRRSIEKEKCVALAVAP